MIDHYLVKTDIITFISHLHQTIKCRSFKNFDVTSFISHIEEQFCNFGQSGNKQINEIWKTWKIKFSTICNLHAPVKSFSIKGNQHPWVDFNIVADIRKRENYIYKQ